MGKIIGAAVAITAIAAAIFAWSKFAVVNPQAAAAANATAAEDRPIISPFNATLRHGKDFPLEDWRPAN